MNFLGQIFRQKCLETEYLLEIQREITGSDRLSGCVFLGCLILATKMKYV